MGAARDRRTVRDEARPRFSRHTTESCGQGRAYADTRLDFDCFDAEKTQISFHYQVVVMPQYEDHDFNEAAVHHCLDCFVRLKKEFPDKKLVPPKAVSAASVTHHGEHDVHHPGLSHDETSTIFGQMFQYDDLRTRTVAMSFVPIRLIKNSLVSR